MISKEQKRKAEDSKHERFDLIFLRKLNETGSEFLPRVSDKKHGLPNLSCFKII